MFCEFCGSKLEADVKFCCSCGKPVPVEETVDEWAFEAEPTVNLFMQQNGGSAASDNAVYERAVAERIRADGFNAGMSAQGGYPTQGAAPAAPKKGKKKGLIIALCILAAAIIAGAGIFAVKSGIFKPNDTVDADTLGSVRDRDKDKDKDGEEADEPVAVTAVQHNITLGATVYYDGVETYSFEVSDIQILYDGDDPIFVLGVTWMNLTDEAMDSIMHGGFYQGEELLEEYTGDGAGIDWSSNGLSVMAGEEVQNVKLAARLGSLTDQITAAFGDADIGESGCASFTFDPQEISSAAAEPRFINETPSTEPADKSLKMLYDMFLGGEDIVLHMSHGTVGYDGSITFGDMQMKTISTQHVSGIDDRALIDGTCYYAVRKSSTGAEQFYIGADYRAGESDDDVYSYVIDCGFQIAFYSDGKFEMTMMNGRFASGDGDYSYGSGLYEFQSASGASGSAELLTFGYMLEEYETQKIGVTGAGIYGLLAEAMTALAGSPGTIGGPVEEAPTDAPVAQYLLPSDNQYITEADLVNLTEWEVRVARNEIYARHGYTFKDEELRKHFEEMPWYSAVSSVNADTVSIEMFNEYERANLELIVEYEKSKGWG